MIHLLNPSLQIPVKPEQLAGLILLYFLTVNISQAQDASFDGRVLKLPAIAVVWTDIVYSAEMTWIENSDPITFELTSAEATDYKTEADQNYLDTRWTAYYYWFFLVVHVVEYEGVRFGLTFHPKGILSPDYGPITREKVEATVFWELVGIRPD